MERRAESVASGGRCAFNVLRCRNSSRNKSVKNLFFLQPR